MEPIDERAGGPVGTAGELVQGGGAYYVGSLCGRQVGVLDQVFDDAALLGSRRAPLLMELLERDDGCAGLVAVPDIVDSAESSTRNQLLLRASLLADQLPQLHHLGFGWRGLSDTIPRTGTHAVRSLQAV
jgi:hypothetical protein